ncbi:MAG: DUF2284 domain-containing protein [Rikenellaceae bacterium]
MKIACLKTKDYITQYRDQDKFFALCEKCPNFNKVWSCPPYDFSGLSIFTPYTYIYIFAHKISPEKNLRQERKILDSKLLELEHRHPDSLAFYAGSCVICDECTRAKGEKCTNPSSMRYSLESLGFDLSLTSKDLLGIDIKWGKNGQAPEYYTLISALCSKTEIEI